MLLLSSRDVIIKLSLEIMIDDDVKIMMNCFDVNLSQMSYTDEEKAIQCTSISKCS